MIDNDDEEYETITIFQRKRKSKEATKKSTKSKDSDFVKNNESKTKQQKPNRSEPEETIAKVPRSVYSDNIFQRRGKKQKY